MGRGALARPGSRCCRSPPRALRGRRVPDAVPGAGLALPAPEVIEIMPDGTEIARHESPLLREIVTGMMEYSTNLTAEVLGLSASGAGDGDLGQGDGGAAARAGHCRPFSLHDHSGLSPGEPHDGAGAGADPGRAGRRRDLRTVMKEISLRDAKGRRRTARSVFRPRPGH